MRSGATTLPQTGEQTTMSSLEIAERTGKTHAHVIRDIRVMLAGLDITEAKFGSSYRDATGRSLPCFNLPKHECLILVSGYSVTMRAAIIDRWQELEQAQAPRIPTHVEALRLAADAIERAEQETALKLIAQERVKELEPMAAVIRCLVPDERRLVSRKHLAVRNGNPMATVSPLTPSVTLCGPPSV